MLNAYGEVAGIVTLKKTDAANIGFALYLSEVAAAGKKASVNALKIKAAPGPTALAKLPLPKSITASKAHWDIIKGTAKEEKGVLILDDNGGTYWVASKQVLPENFQLVIRCQIEFLEGNQVIYDSQESILRMLCVRFATNDTKTDIMERIGNLFQFSHKLALLYKDGKDLQVERKGNGEDAFSLTITKKGGDYTVAADGEILLKYHDDKPLKSDAKFCIGGYLSRLYLSDVSVIKLDAN